LQQRHRYPITSSARASSVGGSIPRYSIPDAVEGELSPFCTDLNDRCQIPAQIFIRAPAAALGAFPMAVILHDLLLFSCLAAFVTGIVIAAASLLS